MQRSLIFLSCSKPLQVSQPLTIRMKYRHLKPNPFVTWTLLTTQATFALLPTWYVSLQQFLNCLQSLCPPGCSSPEPLSMLFLPSGGSLLCLRLAHSFLTLRHSLGITISKKPCGIPACFSTLPLCPPITLQKPPYHHTYHVLSQVLLMRLCSDWSWGYYSSLYSTI